MPFVCLEAWKIENITLLRRGICRAIEETVGMSS